MSTINGKSNELYSKNINVEIEEDYRTKSNTLLFPNPASDKVFIKVLDNSKLALIEIFDVHGRLVKIQNIKSFVNTENIEVNLFSLEDGHYFFKLKSQNGDLLGIKKLIILHN